MSTRRWRETSTTRSECRCAQRERPPTARASTPLSAARVQRPIFRRRVVCHERQRRRHCARVEGDQIDCFAVVELPLVARSHTLVCSRAPPRRCACSGACESDAPPAAAIDRCAAQQRPRAPRHASEEQGAQANAHSQPDRLASRTVSRLVAASFSVCCCRRRRRLLCSVLSDARRHMPELARIERHHHLPKSIYKVTHSRGRAARRWLRARARRSNASA